MFTDFHHAGYQVSDLDDSIKSYYETSGGHETGRGTVPGLGEFALAQVRDMEVEFLQPEGPNILRGITVPSLHHVAYAVKDLDKVVAEYKSQGFRFATEEPFSNFMRHRLI
jgi:catechol 2,3-dioxygenase-like lactoylglutathione lyase family enzyme